MERDKPPHVVIEECMDGVVIHDERRLKAVLRACYGISTEALEAGVVAEMREALKSVQRWLLFTAPLPDPDEAIEPLKTIAAVLTKLEPKEDVNA